MVGLGDLPGGIFDSIARGISGDGSIIVGEGNGSGPTEAVIWDENGIQELDVLLTALGVDLAGWQLIRAMDASADGLTIIGQGINPSGFNEAWIAIIPEPSTALLMGLGLVGLARRRRANLFPSRYRPAANR